MNFDHPFILNAPVGTHHDKLAPASVSSICSSLYCVTLKPSTGSSEVIMTLVRTLIILTLAAQLSACGIMTTTPKPPPPPTAQAQEIVRAQTAELVKIGTVTAVVRGSPMDVEAEIQRKATAAGARYYVIIMNSETVVPGQWYSQAILYR